MRNWSRYAVILLALGLASCAFRGADAVPDPVSREGLSSPAPLHDEAPPSLRQITTPRAIRDSKIYSVYWRTFAPRNGKEREIMRRMLDRAQRVLPYARRVFAAHGLPPELTFLPIVESAFKFGARSRAGAVGLWQFMPYTARECGLAVDWWLDERRDPYLSTLAAAGYLKRLHEAFDDWSLALAAYNCGPGKVRRALACGGQGTFMSLVRSGRLPEETIHFVPKFLAVLDALEAMESAGLEVLNQNIGHDVLHFEVSGNTDLRGLAGACGLQWSSFRKLNPHFKRRATPPESVCSIYVPKEVEFKAKAYLCGPPMRLAEINRNKFFKNYYQNPIIAPDYSIDSGGDVVVADIGDTAPALSRRARDRIDGKEIASILDWHGPRSSLFSALARESQESSWRYVEPTSEERDDPDPGRSLVRGSAAGNPFPKVGAFPEKIMPGGELTAMVDAPARDLRGLSQQPVPELIFLAPGIVSFYRSMAAPG